MWAHEGDRKEELPANLRHKIQKENPAKNISRSVRFMPNDAPGIRGQTALLGLKSGMGALIAIIEWRLDGFLIKVWTD